MRICGIARRIWCRSYNLQHWQAGCSVITPLLLRRRSIPERMSSKQFDSSSWWVALWLGETRGEGSSKLDSIHSRALLFQLLQALLDYFQVPADIRILGIEFLGLEKLTDGAVVFHLVLEDAGKVEVRVNVTGI